MLSSLVERLVSIVEEWFKSHEESDPEYKKALQMQEFWTQYLAKSNKV